LTPKNKLEEEDLVTKINISFVFFFGIEVTFQRKIICFFGDTDMMDWACLHAKVRGYKYWSAFTTGKSPSLGGIPHDLYGNKHSFSFCQIISHSLFKHFHLSIQQFVS
jgi:hypothetical protein